MRNKNKILYSSALIAMLAVSALYGAMLYSSQVIPAQLLIVKHTPDADGWFELTLAVPAENWSPQRNAELSHWKYLGFLNWTMDYDGDPTTSDTTQLRHIYVLDTPNVWTNVGVNWTLNKMQNPSFEAGTDYAQYISVHTSIATGTVGFTSTTIANEVGNNGLQRAAGTYAQNAASGGDQIVNQTKSFSVTGSTLAINATGLWSKSSGGVLIAGGQFMPTNVVSGDTLQVRHSSALTQA